MKVLRAYSSFFPKVLPQPENFIFAVQLVILIVTMIAWLGCTGSEPSAKQGEKPDAPPSLSLRFKEVTTEAGLGEFRHETGAFGEKWIPESMGSGCGFIDYNGDSWQDILLVAGGEFPESGREPIPALWLYRNNRDGTFTQVSRETGLADVIAYGLGMAVGDYDNDGDEDLYFSTLWEDMLFRNDGGVFTDVSEESGVGHASFWSSSAIFFDADRDGWLDLYVGAYIEWSPETDLWCTSTGKTKDYCTPELYPGIPGRYYHNNGDGTFTDKSAEAGFIPSPGINLGVAELDFNRDSWPDLLVSNDTKPDQLYRNNGDGTFKEVGAMSGIAYDEDGRARAGMGVDVGVIDDTGEETIFVANFAKEMIGIFRHIGNGIFIDRSAASKIGLSSLMVLTFSIVLIDADLDGDLDLFAANGHVQPDIEATEDGIPYAQAARMFMNQGNGIFQDIAAQTGDDLVRPIVARSAAYADYDRDGDIDLLVAENAGPAHLYRNDLQEGHFLRVSLKGTKSNRNGIGSQVIALLNGKRMYRRVRSGSSYLASHERTAIFGLGDATHVDSLWVHWSSGEISRFGRIEGDREVLLVEGLDTLSEIPMAGGIAITER